MWCSVVQWRLDSNAGQWVAFSFASQNEAVAKLDIDLLWIRTVDRWRSSVRALIHKQANLEYRSTTLVPALSSRLTWIAWHRNLELSSDFTFGCYDEADVLAGDVRSSVVNVQAVALLSDTWWQVVVWLSDPYNSVVGLEETRSFYQKSSPWQH